MKTKNKIYNKILIILVCCFQQITAQNNGDTALLTLKDAVAIALENNHDINISRNDAEVNENNATAGNAGLFPSLDGQGSYTEELNNTNIEFASPQQPPIDRDNARSTSYNASVNFSYNIFGGLGKYYRFESLKNVSKTGNAQLRLTIENTLLSVYQHYFEMVRLAENVRISKMTLQISAERYQRLQNQQKYGGTGRIEVLNARVDLNTDSINYESTKNDLSNARHNLNILLGREPQILFKVDDQLPEPSVIMNKDKLIDSALNSNARVLLAEYQTRNATLQYKITKAGHFPRLDLTSSYGYNRVENEGSFFTKQETFGLSGGLSLRFNIFNGRQQAIRVQNAEIDIDSRKENEIKVVRQIRRDMLNYYNTYTNNLLLLDMAEDDVETAKLNFRKSEELLESGQITSTQYRTAQLNLMRAMLRETQYKIQAKLSEIQLKKAAGMLIEE